MEMMNRAIEDASDFKEVMRKVTTLTDAHREVIQKAKVEAPRHQKRPGENREQYRARVYGKQEA